MAAISGVWLCTLRSRRNTSRSMVQPCTAVSAMTVARTPSTASGSEPSPAMPSAAAPMAVTMAPIMVSSPMARLIWPRMP